MRKLHSSEMINITLNDCKNVCGFCAVYIVLFVIFFLVSISISSTFIYFHWYLKTISTNNNPRTETVIDRIKFH